MNYTLIIINVASESGCLCCCCLEMGMMGLAVAAAALPQKCMHTSATHSQNHGINWISVRNTVQDSDQCAASLFSCLSNLVEKETDSAKT